MTDAYYWKGVPLSEIPRDELEREFILAWEQIKDLNGQYLQAKTDHIHDLVRMRKKYG